MIEESNDGFIDMTIPIRISEDVSIDCEVLTVFPIDERQYIALLPNTKEENIWFYRFVPTGSEEFYLDEIKDDGELELVMERFNLILSEAELDTILEK